jgi:hypothetical protein
MAVDSWARVALASSAAALIHLVLAALAIIVAGWCLIDLPSFRLILGVPVLLAVVAVWPRFGPLPADATVLDRAAAPTLFAMLDAVVTATGAPPPRVVAAGEGFGADGTRIGLRQRRALVLGVPFWLALTAVLELLRRETVMIMRIQAAARSGGAPAAWPQIAAEVIANPAALPPPAARPKPSPFDHHPPLDQRIGRPAEHSADQTAEPSTEPSTEHSAEPGTAPIADDTARGIAAELDRLARRVQRDLILG